MGANAYGYIGVRLATGVWQGVQSVNTRIWLRAVRHVLDLKAPPAFPDVQGTRTMRIMMSALVGGGGVFGASVTASSSSS